METFKGNYSHAKLKEFKTSGINKGSIYVSLKPLIIKKSKWKEFEIFKWRFNRHRELSLFNTMGDEKDSDFDPDFKKENSAENLVRTICYKTTRGSTRTIPWRFKIKI